MRCASHTFRCTSVRSDVPLIHDDAVVVSCEGVDNSRILFIYDVLVGMFELEFVGMVGLQGQVDDAASSREYFSKMPLRGLKVLVIYHSEDHSSQLPTTLSPSTQILDEMRTGLSLCFSI